LASFFASGSSVHGWSTSLGFKLAMIEPDFPVLPSVPNPLMWSACRCVATTAVRPLLPHTPLM
jgi:hypothetical protein